MLFLVTMKNMTWSIIHQKYCWTIINHYNYWRKFLDFSMVGKLDSYLRTAPPSMGNIFREYFHTPGTLQIAPIYHHLSSFMISCPYFTRISAWNSLHFCGALLVTHLGHMAVQLPVDVDLDVGLATFSAKPCMDNELGIWKDPPCSMGQLTMEIWWFSIAKLKN